MNEEHMKIYKDAVAAYFKELACRDWRQQWENVLTYYSVTAIPDCSLDVPWYKYQNLSLNFRQSIVTLVLLLHNLKSRAKFYSVLN